MWCSGKKFWRLEYGKNFFWYTFLTIFSIDDLPVLKNIPRLLIWFWNEPVKFCDFLMVTSSGRQCDSYIKWRYNYSTLLVENPSQYSVLLNSRYGWVNLDCFDWLNTLDLPLEWITEGVVCDVRTENVHQFLRLVSYLNLQVLLILKTWYIWNVCLASLKISSKCKFLSKK